jgi:hypothetical protein
MAVYMSETIELLRKISNKLRPKTTLKVNRNNGVGISFEQVQLPELYDEVDEMSGDQLFGHPIIKEIQEKNKG